MADTDIKKKLDKAIRSNMKKALDEWRVLGAGATAFGWSAPSREMVYRKLAREINKDFPGYDVSVETVKSHFNQYTPPLFLLVWYAQRFGISLDKFLTGHQNSRIATAEDVADAVNYYIDETRDLEEELRVKVFDLEGIFDLGGSNDDILF